jgi:UDP-glucose 4-epimerase
MQDGKKRVVIAGVSSWYGTELARRLQGDSRIEQVIGIDARPPDADLGDVEFIEADIRSPVLSRLLPATEADTVVHAGIVWYPGPGKPARALHDINVIGTLQLVAACEKTPTLRALIVRSSAAIYGSEGASPAFFTEPMAGSYPLKTRFQRDVSELESYVQNLARRRPEVTCCTLRYQLEIGPGIDTPLIRLLSLPVVPIQMGFDPRLQLIHVRDAVGALEAAVFNPVPGAVNVAPSGTISLSKALRIAGRLPLPVPHPVFAPLVGRARGALGLADLVGDAVRLLRYGRGVDNTRMREELGFEPEFDAEGAVRDFARHQQGRRVGPSPSVGGALGRLSRVLERAGV